MNNFLRQTHFFFEFSHYLDLYRNQIIIIQKFYKSKIMSPMVIISKLWKNICKTILFEDQKLIKNSTEEIEYRSNKIKEGFSEVSLDDCIRNIKP